MRLIDLDDDDIVYCGDDGEYVKYNIPADMPTVDAVPVRHGKWIDMADFEQCSVCTGTHLKEVQGYYGKMLWVKTPYCPNCGARMDWGDGDPNGFNEETIQALKDTTERKNLSKVYETLDDMYADMETDCVPVIRCKDCKYWDEYYCRNRWYGNGYANYIPPIKTEDGFCDWAERKEE